MSHLRVIIQNDAVASSGSGATAAAVLSDTYPLSFTVVAERRTQQEVMQLRAGCSTMLRSSLRLRKTC